MLGKTRQEEKGMTEDVMVGCHHWLNGHEFEQALGVGDGQWSLACCNPLGPKELDTTEWLNWTELNWTGLQHARLPWQPPTPGACSNSCPLSQWCHPTISSSVVVFSSCFHSFPASRSFQMNQFFSSGGQSIGASASASVLPVNIQGWFSLGLTE